MDLFVRLIDSKLRDLEDCEGLAERKGRCESYLNEFVNSSLELVKLSNSLPTGAEYTGYANEPDIQAELARLRERCSEVILRVGKFVKAQTCEKELDPSSLQVFEALSEEIKLGLAASRRGAGMRVAELQSQRLRVPKIRNEESEDAMAGAGAKDAEKSQSPEHEKLLRFTTMRLKKYTLRMSLQGSSQKKPQAMWKKISDNFSTRFLNPVRGKKHNPIRPKVSIPPINSCESGDFETLENEFVPMLYPSWEYLRDVKPAPLPHPYLAEINSLEWSEVKTPHSHRGRKILGGGTLLRLTEVDRGQGVCVGRTVETLKELKEMIKEIKRHKLLAIDVEHHCRHSYRGFVCLIQFSVPGGCDWIVDPFRIFGELYRLNAVTTDPKIIKVMHGADSDVLWLQRDFGVFVVNLFDTLRAAEVLSIKDRSLSTLLEKLCGVVLDKSHQLSDWRIRPIPPDMLEYARKDVRHLIELYHILKNMALKKSVNEVLKIMSKSRITCLKQYRENSLGIFGRATSICRRGGLSTDKISSFRRNLILNFLFFRNYAARVLDENESLILPNHSIIALSKDCSDATAVKKFSGQLGHIKELGRHIPYLLRLRYTIKCCLEELEKTGEELKCPVKLSSLEVSGEPGIAGTVAGYRIENRTKVYNERNCESLRETLDVYRQLANGNSSCGGLKRLLAPDFGELQTLKKPFNFKHFK